MTSKRERQLRADYNLSAEDYEALLESQEFVCAVCEQQDHRVRDDGTPFPLSVDHNHGGDKRVRGLLCGRCNTAIGLLRDDPELCTRASEYLKLHGFTSSRD